MSAKFYVRLAGPMRAAFACLSLLCLNLMSPQPAEAQRLTSESKLDKLQAGFGDMRLKHKRLKHAKTARIGPAKRT